MQLSRKEIIMEKVMKDKYGSTIYDRINAVQMSEYERKAAISAMRDAEMIVDGITWIARKIERLAERLFLKPGFKH
jgi:hypothetical protein